MPPLFIEGTEPVRAYYGYWPIFHNAEVLSLTLDRTSVHFGRAPSAKLKLLVHCMDTRQVGDFERKKGNALIQFEFDAVDKIQLEGFNHQNALHQIWFEEDSDRFKVELESAFGLGGSFVTGAGRVLSLVPCDDEGRPF